MCDEQGLLGFNDALARMSTIHGETRELLMAAVADGASWAHKVGLADLQLYVRSLSFRCATNKVDAGLMSDVRMAAWAGTLLAPNDVILFERAWEEGQRDAEPDLAPVNPDEIGVSSVGGDG